MKIITAYQEFKEFRNTLESISFVPTMGNLHKGHMALIDKARSYDSHISASIFINPLQFNDASDFNNYPKSYAYQSPLSPINKNNNSIESFEYKCDPFISINYNNILRI